MQWGASTAILAAQVHAFKLEKVDWYWLVALGGHVQHIDAEIIRGVHISSIVNKNLTQLDIALEWSKVQGREAIAGVFSINPLYQLLSRATLISSEPQNGLRALRAVMESALVK